MESEKKKRGMLSNLNAKFNVKLNFVIELKTIWKNSENFIVLLE